MVRHLLLICDDFVFLPYKSFLKDGVVIFEGKEKAAISMPPPICDPCWGFRQLFTYTVLRRLTDLDSKAPSVGIGEVASLAARPLLF